MKRIPVLRIFFYLLFIPLLLTSCDLTANEVSNSQIWIDVPLNETSFEPGQSVNIEGHAASAGQDYQVEIWINGDHLENLDLVPLKGNLSYFTFNYLPPGSGDYIIQAVLVGSTSENLPSDTTRISVGGNVEETAEMTPSLTITMTPEASMTESLSETPTQTPEISVKFWADPLPVQAGGCTTIYWEAENVSMVVFGDVEQPLSGSYQVCEICEPENYRLLVTYSDGHEETIWLEITITGSCATSTPMPTITLTPTPVDTTAPPAPSPSVPTNGLSLSCRSTQSLTWVPVSDPSGIAEYQVEVQRSSDNSTWSNDSGSPINGILDKTTPVSTECGWYYRWRVRAVDGAGNASDWSPWFYFSITLA